MGDSEGDARLAQKEVSEMLVALLPQLRRYARHLADDDAEAEDLVQETCRRALEARSQFRPGSNALAWLRRILRNKFLDDRRRALHDVCLDDVRLEAAAPPAISLWRQVSDEEFQAAVNALPSQYRMTYRRHALEGQPYQQIAQEAGISPQTVGVRLLRARTKVRAILVQRLAEP
jgi:RNA polymerase sigma-70 factor (ECF subfamily)